ncbi:MAG: hypothetical protein AAGC77_10485 [Pseudomonadota bacterium]
MNFRVFSAIVASFICAICFVPIANAESGRTTCNTRGLVTPSGQSTGRWETVAAIKGGISSLVKVNENWYECVGGGSTRGIHYVVGVIPGMTADESAKYVHGEMIKALAEDRATNFQPYKQTTQPDGTVKETGGSAGDVDDFKRVKDGVVAKLVADHGMKNVKTTATKIGGMKVSEFLEAGADAIKAGKAFEVDIDMGGGAGHFAFVGEVVRRGNEWGVIIADDNQNNGKPETRPRGPYFFPDGGGCYSFDLEGNRISCTYKLRGALIEEKG